MFKNWMSLHSLLWCHFLYLFRTLNIWNCIYNWIIFYSGTYQEVGTTDVRSQLMCWKQKWRGKRKWSDPRAKLWIPKKKKRSCGLCGDQFPSKMGPRTDNRWQGDSCPRLIDVCEEWRKAHLTTGYNRKVSEHTVHLSLLYVGLHSYESCGRSAPADPCLLPKKSYNVF